MPRGVSQQSDLDGVRLKLGPKRISIKHKQPKSLKVNMLEFEDGRFDFGFESLVRTQLEGTWPRSASDRPKVSPRSWPKGERKSAPSHPKDGPRSGEGGPNFKVTPESVQIQVQKVSGQGSGWRGRLRLEKLVW